MHPVAQQEADDDDDDDDVDDEDYARQLDREINGLRSRPARRVSRLACPGCWGAPRQEHLPVHVQGRASACKRQWGAAAPAPACHVARTGVRLPIPTRGGGSVGET